MAFNREEWLAEMERLKDVPFLDGEEWKASQWIDEEVKKKPHNLLSDSKLKIIFRN